MATKSRNPARERLRQARLRLEEAQRSLDEARSAVDEAQRRQYEAARRAEELLEEEEKRTRDVVTMIAAGDVAELLRPDAEIDALQEEARAWKRAREVAQGIAESRLAELERARANVDEAARVAIDEEVDAERLIAEAQAARAVVLEKQHELMSVMALLPDDSAKRRAIDDFLSESWLLAPFDQWSTKESQRWADAFKALALGK